MKTLEEIKRSIKMEEIRIEDGNNRIEAKMDETRHYTNMSSISSVMAEATNIKRTIEEAQERLTILNWLEGKEEEEIEEAFAAEKNRLSHTDATIEEKMDEVKRLSANGNDLNTLHNLDSINAIVAETDRLEEQNNQTKERMTILAWALRN